MALEKLPSVVYLPTGKVHAVYAAGGPQDGSLHGMYTNCGKVIDLARDAEKWDERPGADVTCRVCQSHEPEMRRMFARRRLINSAWLVVTNLRHSTTLSPSAQASIDTLRDALEEWEAAQ